MTAFRQKVPAGQPRTLRSIAQTKGAAPANLLDADAGYDTNAGIPVTERGAYQEYQRLEGDFFPQVPQQKPPVAFNGLKRGG
jgi:hypothetical protein